MSKTISFSVTDTEYHLIRFEAQSKGLTPSQYAKMATFSHTNKYGSKGVFAELRRIIGEAGESRQKPTFVGSEGLSLEARDQ